MDISQASKGRAPWAADGHCIEGGHRQVKKQKPLKRMGLGKVLGVWMDGKGWVSEAVSERHLQKAYSEGQILSWDRMMVKVMILTTVPGEKQGPENLKVKPEPL